MAGEMIDIFVQNGHIGSIAGLINGLAAKLTEHGYHVRVLQGIGTEDWFQKGLDYTTLNVQARDVGEFVPNCTESYTQFLRARGVPRLIIATDAPYMSYVSRKALQAAVNDDNEHDTLIASWIHNPVWHYERVGMGGMSHLSYADAHFTINSRIGEQIRESLGCEKTMLVWNAVDMKGIAALTTWNKKSRKLLFVGRVDNYQKRLDIIIAALVLAKNRWTLSVVGDGDDKAELVQLAEDFNVADRITWHGWHTDPWEVPYDDVTAMVVASDWEGLSLSAVEALARGIPVISTPCDGIVEYLKHGVSGYMFKHDDMEGLANILNEIDDGALPGIDPKNCVKAVEMCESGRVYENFANKVEELMHLSESVPA